MSSVRLQTDQLNARHFRLKAKATELTRHFRLKAEVTELTRGFRLQAEVRGALWV